MFSVTDEDVPEDKIELVDENGKFYNSCFTFKECTPINKTMADRFKRRVVCEEKRCQRYKLLMENCLEIHNRAFHRDQQFQEGLRPKEHRCRKEKGKLNCGTLTETNIKGQPKYRDEKGCEYPDIESFRNRTMLPEIEIKENQRKRE